MKGRERSNRDSRTDKQMDGETETDRQNGSVETLDSTGILD